MSVNSIFTSNSSSQVQRPNHFFGISKTEISRLSMRLFGIGATGAGISAVAAAVLGIVSWPIGLLAIPCAAGTAGAIWYSAYLDDYENPEELAKYRDDAARMSLEQVIQAHGWSNVLRWGMITAEQLTDKFRQQMQGKNLIEIIDAYEKMVYHISRCPYQKFDYQVSTPSQWQGQWRSETASKTFEEIIQTYPLDKLEKYNLLEVGELRQIKSLKSDYERIKTIYEAQINQIEIEFQNCTGTYQRNYQSECAQAEQLYSDNSAIRRLNVFEIEYIRERQAVQERANRRRTEARNRFDLAIAPMTNHGQIPYERLSVTDKGLYDQQNNALQVTLATVDHEVRTQIANIDSRCIEERNHLRVEECRIREERTRLISEAKNRYDVAVASHRQNKEKRLTPVNALFRSAVDDFNSRYRAYLRIIGASH